MMMMNAPKRALCSFRVVEEEKKFVVTRVLFLYYSKKYARGMQNVCSA